MARTTRRSAGCAARATASDRRGSGPAEGGWDQREPGDAVEQGDPAGRSGHPARDDKSPVPVARGS